MAQKSSLEQSFFLFLRTTSITGLPLNFDISRADYFSLIKSTTESLVQRNGTGIIKSKSRFEISVFCQIICKAVVANLSENFSRIKFFERVFIL